MGSILMVILVLASGIYIAARIASIAEAEKHEKWLKLLESARERRIDRLYGRDKDEEGRELK
jgi:hypothetical protein